MLFLRKKEGFTLIELVVVIAIIGILAVLLMPNVADIHDEAALSAALSDARAIKTAMDSYFNKNKKYPDAGATGINDYASLRSTLADWIALPGPTNPEPAKASFVFDPANKQGSYTRPTPKTFELVIIAKDSAATPIYIRQTGVVY